ncbi:MAG: GntR family transcriptional regulator [Solirubrobacteraceae bacterium]
MTTLDRQLTPSSIRQQAVRAIRAAIVYGELAPREVHSAPALAARMGVSVTPIREALLELAGRGMVAPVRNRGFRVVQHTAAELDAALELRALVELPMMARVAGRLSEADLGRLRKLVERGCEAARARELPLFLDLDRDFHLGLLAHAGNPRIVELVDRLLDQLRFATRAAADRGPSLEEVAEGHRAILAEIEAGDGAAAELRAREHLALTRGSWLDG